MTFRAARVSRVAAPEHTCWAFDDDRSFCRYAREFLHAGLGHGEQVWYVPGPRSGGVAEWLRDAARGREESVRILAPEVAYPADGFIDPAEQITAYVAATEAALAAGFTGLRVVADATTLIRTAAHLDAFARYEFAIGRYMRIAPLRALCVFDRTTLGDDTVAELACLHPSTNAPGVPFRLQAGATARVAVLHGELDVASVDLFAAAIRRADLRPARGTVVVHAEGLRFIGHHCLAVLQRYAEQRAVTVVIRTRLRTVPTMVDLLGLSRIRVEMIA
ncbi:MEDS domain-containing protein [Actinoplanes sp. NEAU-A12]|uniref:MEDS domain-containing protein n=1 Tax=Actinoplanes sandaracinus TaxID=3045177 RepID=A0ABT6WME9_9ACTN|nr:MEDS domain-containing protein [Actinoplanes sandaracinus]MDI6100820.1 MEDS domain-containing protein [Actinoplanes sandaracinus]